MLKAENMTSRGGKSELKVSEIHTHLGKSHVLQGISLDVNEGETVSLLGRNGMGKTTLIRTIMHFYNTSHGNVVFRDQDITHWDTFRIARAGIGHVPQGRGIFTTLSTAENLEIGKQSKRQGQWTLDRVLTIFPALRNRLQNLAGNLSGGEQQMLAIGRMLMGNPRIALMDEPSEGLSPLLVWELASIIQELKQDKVSILLTEQNVNFAANSSDYVYLINNGITVYDSDTDTLLKNDAVKTRYLGI